MRMARMACCALFAAGIAGTSAAMAAAVGDISTLKPRTQNGITYVTGGVGEEQQAQMQALSQAGYNLRLVFAEKGTGAYVANVKVNIADSHGKTVLTAVSDGPGFYAKLPDGDYTITTEYKGNTQTRKIRASRNLALMIYWPREAGSEPVATSDRVPHAAAPAMSPSNARRSATITQPAPH